MKARYLVPEGDTILAPLMAPLAVSLVDPFASLYTPDPDDLSGLILWLDAQTVALDFDDAELVTTWIDSSGLANDFAQANAAKQPTLRTNVQNGLPAVRFDGGDCMTKAITLTSPTGWTIFICCGTMTGSSTQMLLESSAAFGSNNGTFALARTATDRLEASIRGTTNVHGVISPHPMPAPAIATLWSDQANTHVHEAYGFVNGRPSIGGVMNGTYGTATAASYSNQTWHLGARNDAASIPMTGDIYEVIAYKRPLSMAERRGIERYLANKWGATLEHSDWVILGVGHSQMRAAADNGATPLPALKQLATMRNFDIEAINFGIDGQEMDEMILNDPAKIDHHLTNLDAKALLMVYGTGNDMGAVPPNDDQTGETALSRLTTYCTARRAAGWTGRHKIVAVEEPAQTTTAKGATWSARRAVFNAGLPAMVGDEIDGIVAQASNANIGVDGAETNAAFYDQGSSNHPIQLGYAVLANVMADTLDDMNIETHASFLPTDVPFCALWFRGDSLSGQADASAVTLWRDESGCGRDAEQATAAKQPTVRHSVAFANNKTTVRFDGGDCLRTPSWDPLRENVTIYAVFSSTAGADDMIYEHGASSGTVNGTFGAFRSAGNKIVALMDANNVNESTSTDSFSGATTLGLACWQFNPWLTSASVHQTRVYLNGDQDADITQSGTGGQTLSSAVGNIGARNDAASLGLNGDIAELIVYDGFHNAGYRKLIEDYLAAKYAITTRTITANLAFELDNLTTGTQAPGDSYPQQLVNRLTDGVHWLVPAAPDLQISTATTNDRTGPYYRTEFGTKNIVVLWGGTNDIAPSIGNQTSATALTRYYAYADLLRARGWKVIGLDIIPRSDQGVNQATFDTRKGEFNTDVASNWASHLDVFVQISADSRFDDATDTTYYNADTVNLNATGYSAVADLVETALGTFGVT